MRVPALRLDSGELLTQSLAIIEYLDEIHPQPPLLPRDPVGRAKVRALAQLIACDIHPLNNVAPLRYLKNELGPGPGQDRRLVSSLGAATASTRSKPWCGPGPYAYGAEVTLADICLVPQVANARRLKVPLDRYPEDRRDRRGLRQAAGLRQARPENQPDAE